MFLICTCFQIPGFSSVLRSRVPFSHSGNYVGQCEFGNKAKGVSAPDPYSLAVAAVDGCIADDDTDHFFLYEESHACSCLVSYLYSTRASDLCYRLTTISQGYRFRGLLRYPLIYPSLPTRLQYHQPMLGLTHFCRFSLFLFV